MRDIIKCGEKCSDEDVRKIFRKIMKGVPSNEYDFFDRIMKNKEFREWFDKEIRELVNALHKAVSIVMDNSDIDEELKKKLDDNLGDFCRKLDDMINEFGLTAFSQGLAAGESYLYLYAVREYLLMLKKYPPKRRYKIIPKPTYFRYLEKLEWISNSEFFKEYRNLLETIKNIAKMEK